MWLFLFYFITARVTLSIINVLVRQNWVDVDRRPTILFSINHLWMLKFYNLRLLNRVRVFFYLVNFFKQYNELIFFLLKNLMQIGNQNNYTFITLESEALRTYTFLYYRNVYRVIKNRNLFFIFSKFTYVFLLMRVYWVFLRFLVNYSATRHRFYLNTWL